MHTLPSPIDRRANQGVGTLSSHPTVSLHQLSVNQNADQDRIPYDSKGTSVKVLPNIYRNILQTIDDYKLQIRHTLHLRPFEAGFWSAEKSMNMAMSYNIVKLLLLGLSGIGFYFTWYLLLNNGSADFMADIRDNGPHVLPFTDKVPLKRVYTGMGPVDYQLTTLMLFFYNILDGSHPHASLQAYQFVGQLITGWSLLVLESLRESNRGRLISL